MTATMDELKKILKSILISSPMKLRVDQLNEEYKSFIGQNIPFAEYGYNNLVQFLKCFPDMLTVDGNDLSSLVTHKFGNRLIRIKKTKSKKKKSKEVKKAQFITSTPKEKRNSEKPASSIHCQDYGVPKTSKYSSPLGINFNMQINYEKETMRLATEIDYGKIADIRRKILPKISKEEQSKKEYETKKTLQQGLRYPKTVVSIEKNGKEVGFGPFKPVEAGSRNSMNLEKVSQKLTLYEYFKKSKKVLRKPMKIPSMTKLTPKLLEWSDITSMSKDQMAISKSEIPTWIQTPVSLMDLPIPPMIPGVPKEFNDPNSDDLIDFNGIPNINSVPETLRVEPTSKSIPFLDVLRLVEMLKISHLN